MTTPCRNNPAAFEIPDDEGRAVSPAVKARVAAAVTQCRTTCPLLAACAQAAADNPPEHRCVMAGEVYDGAKRCIKPRNLTDWYAYIRAPEPPGSVDGGQCEHCKEPLPPAYGRVQVARRYCDLTCRKAEQRLRAKGRQFRDEAVTKAVRGEPIKLSGAETREAIRRLGEHLTRKQIAAHLRKDARAVSSTCTRWRIPTASRPFAHDGYTKAA